MVAEIIKLRKEILPGGKEGQIMYKDDFIRLISKYKLTLSLFIEMGLSRSIWDNTLSYYGWGVNDIQGLRLSEYSESKHLSSYKGFSTVIPIDKLRPSLKMKESGIAYMVNKLDGYFPGVKQTYSEYHDYPEKVNNLLLDITRELMDLQLIARYVNRRVIKWAKNHGLKYKQTIHSKLEHNFAKLLDDLGLSYYPQYYIEPYWYDFYLGKHNLIIEIDGGKHDDRYDLKKESILKNKGIDLLRLDIRGIFELKRDYETIKNKISRRVGIS